MMRDIGDQMRFPALAGGNAGRIILVALCAWWSSPSAHAAPTYTTFDVPGALRTEPASIGTDGTIVGSYMIAHETYHGFIRAPGGTITSIDPPGSTYTTITSVNATGWLTGTYVQGGHTHGFLRSPDGTITAFILPGSTDTLPSSLNGKAMIVGGANGSGFVRTFNGKITVFNPPQSVGTAALSVNFAGAITGFYKDRKAMYHGFLRDAGGTITSFDAPGALQVQNVGTMASAINTAGVVAGIYQDTPGNKNHFRGFVRAVDGAFVTFGVPRGISDSFSLIGDVSINAKGEVAGSYQYQSAGVSGFIRTASGKFRKFAISGAATTVVRSVNNAGAVAGQYTVSGSSRVHGFVRTP